jgi:hypothetical protein
VGRANQRVVLVKLALRLLASLGVSLMRLAHLEAKLGVHTAADAVTRALREST